MIAHNVERLITHFSLVDLKLLCSFNFKRNQLQLVLLETHFIGHSFFWVAIFLLTSSFSPRDEIRYLSKYILANFEDIPSLWCAIQTSTYLVLVLSLILIGNVGQILSCYYIMRQYDQDLWSIMNVLFDLTGKNFLRYDNVFLLALF